MSTNPTPTDAILHLCGVAESWIDNAEDGIVDNYGVEAFDDPRGYLEANDDAHGDVERVADTLDALRVVRERQNVGTAHLWFAYMDTEHFEFKAIGATDLHAREQLAAGFARHLMVCAPDKARPFDYWNEDGVTAPDHERLHDHYGIRTIDSRTAQAWCDGEPT